MKHAVLGAVAALALLASSAAVAGPGHSHGPGSDHQHGEAAKLKEVSVDELAKLLAAGKATAVDANGAETRQKFGTIPNAKLLTSSSQFDVNAELPSDKTGMLVFYCANPRCTASDKAAERARAAGWTNVAILRAGIAGWADGGQKTTPNS